MLKLDVVDPDQALRFKAAFEAMDEHQRQRTVEHVQWVGEQSQALLALSPEQRPSAYAQAWQQAQALGIAGLPGGYPGDEALQQAARSARLVQQQVDALKGRAPPASMPIGSSADRLFVLEDDGNATTRTPQGTYH
ncbi:hypothetical protein QMO56_25790 [Roseomonas sp. E05]|uniref:hypothetical protein n=1 Tax=Roseomonas sp. E05 TaxID=3046310 RepID=UPI0024BAA89E|nr:hypothetical protein [Roseomonas sp. E05]MDJ0391520.1 hypothetical protein [Roseomonas sp. E05]